MACALVFAGGAVAQETDLSVVVTDSADPAAPDSTVSYEIEMANAGPDDPNNDADNFVVIDVYLPMGVPVPFIEYLEADEDGRQAISDAFFDSGNIGYDENIWDEGNEDAGFFFGDSRNNYCEGLLLQASPMVLAAGDSGKIYYDAVLPEIGVGGFAFKNAAGEMIYPDYHASACSDAFDGCYAGGGVPCMGPRLTMFEATGAPITLVDDGSDNPTEGCEALVGFPEGHVALIDRGSCAFQDKVQNASDAGASGVIVPNTVGGGAAGGGDDAVLIMACNSDSTCHEVILTAPAASVSYNTGLAIKAAMDEGEVAGYVGIRQEEPNYAVTEANLWELGADTDTDLDNNRFIKNTTFGAAGCTPIYVAAAAAGPGVGDSMWATDVGINNSSDEVLTYSFQMLPRGADNTDVEPIVTGTLEANTNGNFPNIWGTWMGDGAGAINICVSDPDAAGVNSRTYNTSDEGTFGQSIVGMKGMTPEKLIGSGEKVRLGFLSQNSAFRTNVGFMNAGATGITINAEFFTADGTTLGTSSIDIPPFSNNQWNRAFRKVTTDSVDLGYIDVWSDNGDASFLTYASVVDNGTDDPTTIWPFDTSEAVGGGGLDCTPVWIAAAASANGAGGTVWATDVGINNLSSDELTYKFQFLPRGADNTGVEMSDSFTLAGNGSIAYRDIWNEMTGGNGSGAINVCVDSGDAAGITSRTFNTGDAGTFGQMIEGMRGAAPAKVATGEKVRLGYLFENDTYRTNIGFMNAGATEITVMVEFFDHAGNSLGTKGVNLAPYSNNQWNKAYTLAPMNATGIVAGFADVWTDTADANFLTYASIVDNGTGDPTTIWPF